MCAYPSCSRLLRWAEWERTERWRVISSILDECRAHPARAAERIHAWADRDAVHRHDLLWRLERDVLTERPLF